MEILIASAIAMLVAGGLYLMFEARSFPVILGAALLSHAVNLFLFATGRLVFEDAPPIVRADAVNYTDPLPQALVLTAIVISFAMSAVAVILALGGYAGSGSDRTDPGRPQEQEPGE